MRVSTARVRLLAYRIARQDDQQHLHGNETRHDSRVKQNSTCSISINTREQRPCGRQRTFPGTSLRPAAGGWPRRSTIHSEGECPVSPVQRGWGCWASHSS